VIKLNPYHTKGIVEAGCDEAGRGCLAGPVVAAAVILPPGFEHPLLNDSKKMTAHNREKLSAIIKEQAQAWGIGLATVNEIDAINILQASFLAMHRAIDLLQKRAELLLIDGNRFKPYPGIPHQCIIKGDGKYLSIAAASVLAKTCRDEIMNQLDKEYPAYFWNANKGYPTAKHKHAIVNYGICQHHRKSFNLGKQLELFGH
jgi:ribonuclease HII